MTDQRPMDRPLTPLSPLARWTPRGPVAISLLAVTDTPRKDLESPGPTQLTRRGTQNYLRWPRQHPTPRQCVNASARARFSHAAPLQEQDRIDHLGLHHVLQPRRLCRRRLLGHPWLGGPLA